MSDLKDVFSKNAVIESVNASDLVFKGEASSTNVHELQLTTTKALAKNDIPVPKLAHGLERVLFK